MKKLMQVLLAAVLLVGTLSTASMADGSGTPPCPPSGCANPK